MLGQDDLLAWFQSLSIPEPTCSMIDHIRSSGPPRRVGGGRSNVSGRYPSRKMGVTIQFESHRVELAGIYEMEHDATVLEYFDQPPAIKLDYESVTGKRMGVLHTPDFFVIRRGEAASSRGWAIVYARKYPSLAGQGWESSSRGNPADPVSIRMLRILH